MIELLIGAVRILGRWVSQQLLDRLSRRAQGPHPVPRRQLIEEFCRATDWRDPKGELKISSASVALRKLEKLGQVQLPPRAERAPGARRRGLPDDGQPLPPLPPGSGRSPLSGLRLRLIEGPKDPLHPLWNRLVVREHPLGRRPLVAAQLRYLIECEGGLVGAFGFGPAAYHLECRDQWIGWSQKAREENRGQVIGLSRFVIRRGLSVCNLASQCYRLALGQVAEDWRGRYGIKPLLVETYVDRTVYDARSLKASNWRRLGQSKSRGRDDRQRQRAQSVKDVWVYELDRKARTQLQRTSGVERLAPHSVLAPALAQNWVSEEMAGVELGDQRLHKRIEGMLQARWQRPTQSFWRSFENLKEGKRAFEFIENPRPEIQFESLLAPHQQQTARRMAAEKVVLLAQDTTGLSYNSLEQTQGLGSLGEEGSRGLFLHSLQAFRLDGIPLGTAWAEVWARSEQSAGGQRNQQSITEKESARWVRALQAAQERARQMPGTGLIVCSDRESDLYELYDQVQAAPPNVWILVRGQHDRGLADGTRLKAALEAAPVGGTMEVKVPRRQNRPARVATLELRWLEIEVAPPQVTVKRSWPTLKLYALLARESNGPGAEAIEWILLSNCPIKTLKMARRLVRWYALRWGIECWHRVLKVVCGVERRQMKSAQTLERALALDMIVASRVLLLNRLGKEHPDLPAELFYDAEELAVLELKKKESGKFADQPKLTVLQANVLVAMLVGFWARPRDGHPGAQILAEGLMALQVAVWHKRASHSAGQPKGRRRGRPK